jgi:N-acetylglucosaminyldiphosphoundecaprenol N-acetyl-beta-D-mannosaminyltransferase
LNTEKKNKLYFYSNPANAFDFYCIFKKSNFERLYSDGIFIPVILSFFGKNIKRMSPDLTSFANNVFNDAISNNLKVLFIGGESQEICSFRSNISSLYPKLSFANIDGYKCNFEIYKNYVKSYQPNILFVGLGFPKQELLLLELNECYSPFVGYTCGAFISQTSQKKIYYPYLINQLNLRWLYRALTCHHVRKRLIIDYPKFIFKFLTDSKFRYFILNTF